MDVLNYKVSHDLMVEELDKVGKEVLDTFHGNPDFEWNVMIGYSTGLAMEMNFASTKAELSKLESDLATACYKNVEQRLINIFRDFENATDCHIFDLVYIYVGADGSRRIDFQPISRSIPSRPQIQN
jgi:signal transduction histidine kinase